MKAVVIPQWVLIADTQIVSTVQVQMMHLYNVVAPSFKLSLSIEWKYIPAYIRTSARMLGLF